MRIKPPDDETAIRRTARVGEADLEAAHQMCAGLSRPFLFKERDGNVKKLRPSATLRALWGATKR